ncbi:probable transmembrane protein 18 [Coccomyxa sp. Obi]|nr:probable transmembrane protein 18 [Coccomyxa sp. Obi]
METAFDGIAGAMEEVIKEIREKFREASKHAGIWESLKAFVAAVDWKEPWLIALLAFQALLLVSVIVFRKSWNFNLVVLVLAAGVVYNAQRLNRLLAEHWRSFAGQPYFDEQGVFISAVVSAPLLLTMFVQLVSYLCQASQLLIDMKRKELRYKARQRARQERVAAGGTGESKKSS